MVYDVWCMVCGVWSVREKDTRGYVFEVVVEIINVEAIIIMCVDVQCSARRGAAIGLGINLESSVWLMPTARALELHVRWWPVLGGK